jgi:hypothetical protein
MLKKAQGSSRSILKSRRGRSLREAVFNCFFSKCVVRIVSLGPGLCLGEVFFGFCEHFVPVVTCVHKAVMANVPQTFVVGKTETLISQKKGVKF